MVDFMPFLRAVSSFLLPFLQAAKGVGCFPGLGTIEGLWGQGVVNSVFTKEKTAFLEARFSSPPFFSAESFALFSYSPCFLNSSQGKEAGGSNLLIGKGTAAALEDSARPSPGLLWVTEVGFCTEAGVR